MRHFNWYFKHTLIYLSFFSNLRKGWMRWHFSFSWNHLSAFVSIYWTFFFFLLIFCSFCEAMNMLAVHTSWFHTVSVQKFSNYRLLIIWFRGILTQNIALKVMPRLWASGSKQIWIRSFKWGTKHYFWSRGYKNIRGQSWR